MISDKTRAMIEYHESSRSKIIDITKNLNIATCLDADSHRFIHQEYSKILKDFAAATIYKTAPEYGIVANAVVALKKHELTHVIDEMRKGLKEALPATFGVSPDMAFFYSPTRQKACQIKHLVSNPTHYMHIS